MPIIKTRLKLNSMHKDQELTIFADDLSFEEEFNRFCFLADLELIEKQENEGFQTYRVKILR